MSERPRRERNRDMSEERWQTSQSNRDERPPQQPGAPSDVNQRSSPRDQPISPPDASDPPVILVAEDDEPIAEAIALLLEDEGYQPIWVTNGKDALEAARARWPDLVLTDLMMPRMSGSGLIDALRDLAAAEGRPMPPVVLMTAAANPRARGAVELKNEGIVAVISKPFDVSALVALVTRLLEQEFTQ